MNSNTIKILTGKKQTGKTTSLVNFCNQQQNTTGILTPIINGKRFFYDIATKTFFAMEFNNQIGDEIIAVGKYNFSAKAFAKANTILQTIQHNPNQLVIIDC